MRRSSEETLQRVREIFAGYAKRGLPAPTFRQMASELGMRSPTAAKRYVDELIRRGWLEQPAPGVARGIVVSTGVPLIAKFGADEVARIAVPAHLLPEHGALFWFLQPDDRLRSVGIRDGDLLLAGPISCPADPRLAVVAEQKAPVACRWEAAGERRVHGVVVAVQRSLIAGAMR